jgi:hypothetical protein
VRRSFAFAAFFAAFFGSRLVWSTSDLSTDDAFTVFVDLVANA